MFELALLDRVHDFALQLARTDARVTAGGVVGSPELRRLTVDWE